MANARNDTYPTRDKQFVKTDPVRQKIRDLLRERDATMREASLAIGRGSSYMHQFLERGTPRVLRSRDRIALAEWLDCDPESLRQDYVPRRRSAKPRVPRFKPPQLPNAPVSASARWPSTPRPVPAHSTTTTPPKPRAGTCPTP